jgi:hypothetical protein
MMEPLISRTSQTKIQRAYSDPQPIIVEDAVPESPEAAEALRNGELDDVRSPVGDETGTEEVVVIA